MLTYGQLSQDRLTPAPRPGKVSLTGERVILEPLDPAKHAAALWDAVGAPEHDDLWRYLFDGPFRERAAFEAAIAHKASTTDPLFLAIVDRATARAVGYASYMRIEPAHRCIEVGGILFAPPLQRTAGATEAMFLMARHVFEDLGYRRYEWKCDALNAPSRSAALRLGFTFEGIFRQHMIVKGRNRDTAWFSMLDAEWPARKRAFEKWLDLANFDANGRQKTPLAQSSR
jgi:RimJ/RimL family protein N-acetyltransferase